jgi:Icc-related predicted phosphoesterase
VPYWLFEIRVIFRYVIQLNTTPPEMVMRLLAFADIHGAYDRVEHVLGREKPFDAVVLAGDVTTRGTEQEVSDALARFSHFGPPLLAVAGNMDSASFDPLFERLGIGINGHGRLLSDVGFFGVSGSPFTPMHTPYEISEEEIATRSEHGYQEVQSARVKVYVPHAPPSESMVDRLLRGGHGGSTAVRRFIEGRAPDVVVCGHIHEARGLDRIGPSQIINCGPAAEGSYAIITIGETIQVELKE